MKRGAASFLPTLLATAVLFLAGGCEKEDAPPSALPVPAKPVVAIPQAPLVSADALTLLEFKIGKSQTGKPVLKGSVSNASLHTIKLATAAFTLFDKKGMEIGTSTATVDNLEPKFAWTFEAQILQDDVASATFAGFTVK